MTKLQTIIDALAAAVAPGVMTKSLDELAESLCRLHGVIPAFKGYKPPNFGKKNEAGEIEGYPAAVCVSIDNEVIHGIPKDRKIREGEVVKIDMGILDGDQYDDGATTVLVGHCSATARRLVRATQEALEAGVAVAKAGNTTHDIAKAIEAVAKKHEVFVVHGYGGHGCNSVLHAPPHIPNEIDGTPAEMLIVGQRLAIEPMFSSTHGFTEVAKDGWTVKILRGGLAAHFERTIVVS